jgi:hypothetical protein
VASPIDLVLRRRLSVFIISIVVGRDGGLGVAFPAAMTTNPALELNLWASTEPGSTTSTASPRQTINEKAEHT